MTLRSSSPRKAGRTTICLQQSVSRLRKDSVEACSRPTCHRSRLCLWCARILVAYSMRSHRMRATSHLRRSERRSRSSQEILTSRMRTRFAQTASGGAGHAVMNRTESVGTMRQVLWIWTPPLGNLRHSQCGAFTIDTAVSVLRWFSYQTFSPSCSLSHRYPTGPRVGAAHPGYSPEYKSETRSDPS